MIPSRPRLEAARAARDDQGLADFCEFLLAALEIPEMRSALAAAIVAHERADRVTLPPKGPVTGRGQRNNGRR